MYVFPCCLPMLHMYNGRRFVAPIIHTTTRCTNATWNNSSPFSACHLCFAGRGGWGGGDKAAFLYFDLVFCIFCLFVECRASHAPYCTLNVQRFLYKHAAFPPLLCLSLTRHCCNCVYIWFPLRARQPVRSYASSLFLAYAASGGCHPGVNLCGRSSHTKTPINLQGTRFPVQVAACWIFVYCLRRG